MRRRAVILTEEQWEEIAGCIISACSEFCSEDLFGPCGHYELAAILSPDPPDGVV